MKEKYYKIKKEYAERAGLNEHMRESAGDDYLMLSEKDIRMITLTVEEKLIFLLAEGDCPRKEDNIEVPEVDETNDADEHDKADPGDAGEATDDDDYDLPDEEDEQGEEEVEPEIIEE